MCLEIPYVGGIGDGFFDVNLFLLFLVLYASCGEALIGIFDLFINGL